MFDLHLRGVKDRLFQPLVPIIPHSVTPGHLTLVGLLLGLSACAFTAIDSDPSIAVSLWLGNRVFDCLDGAVARERNMASDLGGFYDLLSDFIVYSSIPVAVGVGQSGSSVSLDHIRFVWLGIAVLEASFHVNNFILFYCAAIAAKRGEADTTSAVMKPALIEGFESGVLFTAMLYWPEYIGSLCWMMAVLVCVGIVQRCWWVAEVLSDYADDKKKG